MTREYPHRRPELDSTTEAVLAALIRETPRGHLVKTQAVNLPYLVDVVAKHVLGRRVTRSTYKAKPYGVMATAVYGLFYQSDTGASFVVEEMEGIEGGQIIRLGTDPSAQTLPDEVLEIVEFVSTQYGTLPSEALGELTKKLNDHISGWPSSEAVRVDEVAYEKLPVGWDKK